MKHTEDQILNNAKKVLKDLQKEFFKEENLKKAVYHSKRIPGIGQYEDKEIPCWVALVEEPVFDTSIFLTFSDDTGEPLYIQSSHKLIEIGKDDEGNYYRKEN